MNKRLGEDYGYILRGGLRKKVILNLNNPITPKELSDKINKHLSEASRVLLELTEKGFTECITPRYKTGRVYVLTKKGKAILKEIEKLN